MIYLAYFGPMIFTVGFIVGGELRGWIDRDLREFFWKNVGRF